jgi:ATP-dependent Clp protease ATP-binding subunit ClpX
MMEIMYEIPSNEKIEKCIITKETVENKSYPQVVVNENVATIKKDPALPKPRSKRKSENETA